LLKEHYSKKLSLILLKFLRHTMNWTAAVFIVLGGVFDTGVWWYAKNVEIFDKPKK